MTSRFIRLAPAGATLLTLAIAVTGPVATATATPTTTSPAAPAGFRAQSTTWLDADHGYLLGTLPCGTKTCPRVLGTSDGGATWRSLGRPHAQIARDGRPKRTGVTELRFSTTASGWAFAPLLRHTNDGGRTWTTQDIPGDGGQVLDLATDTAGTWAVVSPCRWGHSGGFRTSPLTLWRTTSPTGTRWTQVPADLPYNVHADITANGSTVYVSDPQLEFGADDVLLASTDGKAFSQRPAPCDHAQDLELVQVVARSATAASMLCDGDPGFSKAVKIVYNTQDTGMTYRNRGMTGLYGIQAQLAVSPSGKLAVASWSDGSFIYVNDSHAKTWQMPVGLGDGGLGWNDIGYVTKTEAYVVYSPVSSFEGQGRLWVTHDAGRSWQDVSP
jgi:hypothetical protein